MPVYRVLHNHILHDGTLYAPGDTIDVTEEQAANLRVAVGPEDEQGKVKAKK